MAGQLLINAIYMVNITGNDTNWIDQHYLRAPAFSFAGVVYVTSILELCVLWIELIKK